MLSPALQVLPTMAGSLGHLPSPAPHPWHGWRGAPSLQAQAASSPCLHKKGCAPTPAVQVPAPPALHPSTGTLTPLPHPHNGAGTSCSRNQAGSTRYQKHRQMPHGSHVPHQTLPTELPVLDPGSRATRSRCREQVPAGASLPIPAGLVPHATPSPSAQGHHAPTGRRAGPGSPGHTDGPHRPPPRLDDLPSLPPLPAQGRPCLPLASAAV